MKTLTHCSFFFFWIYKSLAQRGHKIKFSSMALQQDRGDKICSAPLRFTSLQLPKSQHNIPKPTNTEDRWWQTVFPNCEIQFDWLKGSTSEVGCQKTGAADVAEKNKVSIQCSNYLQKNNLHSDFKSSVLKCLQSRDRSGQQIQRYTGEHLLM